MIDLEQVLTPLDWGHSEALLENGVEQTQTAKTALRRYTAYFGIRLAQQSRCFLELKLDLSGNNRAPEVILKQAGQVAPAVTAFSNKFIHSELLDLLDRDSFQKGRTITAVI